MVQSLLHYLIKVISFKEEFLLEIHVVVSVTYWKGVAAASFVVPSVSASWSVHYFHLSSKSKEKAAFLLKTGKK